MQYRRIAVFYAVLLVTGTVLAENAVAEVEAQDCLVWKVEQHSAQSNNSSCSYFNTNKVSTRVMVRNSCANAVNGVFTYFKTDDEHRSVMNVQHFAVKPGSVVEVANPCNLSQDSNFQVSQVSFSDAEV